MVRPVQPFPMRKLDGTTVWIDPRTNKEIKDSKMNERIREIAEQAKGFVDLNQHIGGTNGCMVYTYDGLEKFAELIVRECVQTLIDNTPERYTNEAAEEDWDKGYDQAMKDCVHHIQKHFGVKR